MTSIFNLFRDWNLNCLGGLVARQRRKGMLKSWREVVVVERNFRDVRLVKVERAMCSSWIRIGEGVGLLVLASVCCFYVENAKRFNGGVTMKGGCSSPVTPDSADFTDIISVVFLKQ